MYFSVVIPVYNVEKYIDECINSVLFQSFTDFELILVDDGSLDNSGNICDEYALRDSRIRVFHKENKGSLHTRCLGIEKSVGDYLVFLDSDDKLKPFALQKIASTFEKYKCDCVVFGLERELDGKVISKICDDKEICLSDKAEIYRHCLLGIENNALCRKAVRSTVFKSVDYSPYYKIKMGEDLLQSLEVYKNSELIAFIPEILYIYRFNPESLTSKKEIVIDYTIRSIVLNFLQTEEVFTPEDWEKYKLFCRRLFTYQLVEICRSGKELKEKKKYFQKIQETDYYQNFIKRDQKYVHSLQDLILCLFRKKKYFILNTMINLKK